MNKIVKNILWIGLAAIVLATAAFAGISAVENRENPQDRIAASGNHAMIIKDGRVKTTGRPVSFPGLSEIANAKQIDASGFTVVIDAEGKLHTNSVDSAEISKWDKIKKVTVGYDFAVGLKKDGTLVAAGGKEYGQTLVSKAKKVKTVSAGAYHYVGLTKSGELFFNGSNENGECNVTDWSDIKDVECGPYATVGLKKDGTVMSTISGVENYDLSGFTDIKKAVTSKDHTVGLKKDGTVVATGNNAYGQCDVSGWTDIIAVKANKNQTIGLKKDGTVVAAGDNQYGQCNTDALNQ